MLNTNTYIYCYKITGTVYLNFILDRYLNFILDRHLNKDYGGKR